MKDIWSERDTKSFMRLIFLSVRHCVRHYYVLER